ncbi:hypothetical protein K8R20_01310 [bacterium]|nr:hypothetical protein [bacterium]
MKLLTKILLTTIIILILPISIYYGLKIQNTNFILEHINRSYVITLPNKVWFEIDGSTDTLNKKQIFGNDTTLLETTGLNWGLQYPTHTATIQNDTAVKTLTGTRVGDTIAIEQNITIFDNEYDTYTTYIYFSQYGLFENNTYTQEGCSVNIGSESGDITYNPKYSIVNITYEIINNTIEDNLLLKISCK